MVTLQIHKRVNLTWYFLPSGASGTAAAISSAELSGSVTFLGMTLTVSSLGGGCEVGCFGGWVAIQLKIFG